MKVRFGPAGTGGNALEGLKRIAAAGLEAVEIEFTYGVRMANDTAKQIGGLAKKLGLMLSIHAPYYINLASEEKQKIGASRTRILQSCERGHHMGAKYIVFHPAFYGKRTPEKTFEMVKEGILKMQDKIKEKGWKTVLAPEATGKPSQFGSIDELLRLKKEAKCHLTVDFAHIKARNNGVIDFDEVFKKLKKVGYIHSHFSGIEFTPKGERRHLVTEKEDFLPFLKAVKKAKPDMTIINESPDPMSDSIMGMKLFKSLK